MKDLPPEGLTRTARLEVSHLNNARIMTLDPENLKGHVNGKSKLKGARNKCDHCAKPSATMQCPCKNARYCDKTCQKGDWKGHKISCSFSKKSENKKEHKKEPQE